MSALRILPVLALMAVAAPALAQPATCKLDEATRALAVEVEKLRSPGPSADAAEEAARLLTPSPCETSPAPQLSFATVDLELAVAEWRRGSRDLEQARGAHQPSHWRTTDSGRRNSQ